jgi:hypothetical protein
MRALLTTLTLGCVLVGAIVPAGASVRLEEWNASLTLHLRTHDAVVGSVQELRGSVLIALDPHFRLFADHSVREGYGSLPELYLRYDNGRQRFKLGRFYLPLGIHDYSELYYVGFISIPLTKYYAFRGSVPYRSEQGFGWDARSGRWSWEVALIGDAGSQETLGLERPRGAVGRLQTAIGPLIVGFNGYDAAEDLQHGGRQVHWYGLDLRYSRPRWVLRGEAFTGTAAGDDISSYYLDVLYHPDALPRWTFLGRAEAVSGVHHHARYTLGARVVLGRGLAGSINWIDNHLKFSSSAGGLNLQLLRTWQY